MRTEGYYMTIGTSNLSDSESWDTYSFWLSVMRYNQTIGQIGFK